MSRSVRIRLAVACSATATLLACAHGDVESRLQALEREADRQAVVRLIHQYAQGIDGGDQALLRRTFLPDAVAEYRGVNFPMDVRLEGIAAIWDWLNAQLADREGAMPWHYMDTELVDVEGDRAHMTVYQHNRLLSGVGVYTVDAVRTEAGWRIEKLHLDERILDPKLLEDVHTPETRERIQR
ncbi:MAG: nuclear transport factor 2 family protein [Myxococcota bacterium]